MPNLEQALLLEEAKQKYKKKQSPMHIQDMTVDSLNNFNPTALPITKMNGEVVAPTYHQNQNKNLQPPSPIVYNVGPKTVDLGNIYIRKAGGEIKVFYKVAKSEGFMAVSRKTNVSIPSIFKANENQGWKELIGDDIGYSTHERSRKLQLGEGVCLGTTANQNLLSLIMFTHKHGSDTLSFTKRDTQTYNILQELTTAQKNDEKAQENVSTTATVPKKIVIDEDQLKNKSFTDVLGGVLRFLSTKTFDPEEENIRTGSLSISIEIQIGLHFFLLQIEGKGGGSMGIEAGGDRRVVGNFTFFAGGNVKAGIPKVAGVEVDYKHSWKTDYNCESVEQLSYILMYILQGYISKKQADSYKEEHQDKFDKSYYKIKSRQSDVVITFNIHSLKVEVSGKKVHQADIKLHKGDTNKSRSEAFKTHQLEQLRANHQFESNFDYTLKVETGIGTFGINLVNKGVNLNLDNNGLFLSIFYSCKSTAITTVLNFLFADRSFMQTLFKLPDKKKLYGLVKSGQLLKEALKYLGDWFVLGCVTMSNPKKFIPALMKSLLKDAKGDASSFIKKLKVIEKLPIEDVFKEIDNYLKKDNKSFIKQQIKANNKRKVDADDTFKATFKIEEDKNEFKNFHLEQVTSISDLDASYAGKAPIVGSLYAGLKVSGSVSEESIVSIGTNTITLLSRIYNQIRSENESKALIQKKKTIFKLIQDYDNGKRNGQREKPTSFLLNKKEYLDKIDMNQVRAWSTIKGDHQSSYNAIAINFAKKACLSAEQAIAKGLDNWEGLDLLHGISPEFMREYFVKDPREFFKGDKKFSEMVGSWDRKEQKIKKEQKVIKSFEQFVLIPLYNDREYYNWQYTNFEK